MSDPRYTDPRDDRHRSDPSARGTVRGDGALWGWIAAIAVLVLIAFVLIAGWNNTGSNTATNTSSGPVTTNNAPGTTPKPTETPPPAANTTGSGTTSSEPTPPAPGAPPKPQQ